MTNKINYYLECEEEHGPKAVSIARLFRLMSYHELKTLAEEIEFIRGYRWDDETHDVVPIRSAKRLTPEMLLQATDRLLPAWSAAEKKLGMVRP